jgi:chromosome segregation protein
MSQSVQFIFITHNKSTMQIADVLSGVTMREAGVSKLVSVNVDDALEMTSDN